MSGMDFVAPTTYSGAMEMVKALDPDGDSTTAEQYVAFERLKTFFRLMLPES